MVVFHQICLIHQYMTSISMDLHIIQIQEYNAFSLDSQFIQNQPCKFNWRLQTCSHLFIHLIKSTRKLTPSVLKNSQGVIFSFKVKKSSQRISQMVFSFRVTVANILQTYGNVHKPIHAKDHLWFCIEICPWGNLVLLNLNVFNLQGQATSCEPFLIRKKHTTVDLATLISRHHGKW